MERAGIEQEFDLQSVIGKKVHLTIMLDWDLKFPEGRFVRLLHSDRSQINYLLELDSPITFEPHIMGPFRARPPLISTSRLVIVFRRPEIIHEDLHGDGGGEFGAPILLYLVGDASPPTKLIDFVRSHDALGPVRVELID